MIQLRGLHPSIRQRAEVTLATARKLGIPVTVARTRATWADSEALYRTALDCASRGLLGTGAADGACAFPAAPPGDSAHNYGYAFDAVVPPEHQQMFDAIRRAFGWQIYPNDDPPHTELPNWRALRDGWVGPAG